MDKIMMHRNEENTDNINNNNNISYNSDNENNNTSTSCQSSGNNLSKAELRKTNKPIMEKRRRERINHCLNELKSLILEAMNRDPARHTKLEKADILEMTVKHLQAIQRQKLSLAIQTDPSVIHKFKTGFAECAEEVNRYVNQLDNIDTGVRQRLTNHLNTCITGLDQIGTFSSFSNSFRTRSATSFGMPLQQNGTIFPIPQDVNNNARIQMGGVQLIPSRLPSGELALIMPNSTTMPFFQTQSLDMPDNFPRLSAFTKPFNNGRPSTSQITMSSRTTTSNSPPLSPISSLSSLGDESMQTSSDFHTKTPPPLQTSSSFSSDFSSPPSAESTKFGLNISNLQQPFVSSTTEIFSNKNILETNRKRKYPYEINENENQPEIKLIKTEEKNNLIKIEENDNLINDQHSGEHSNDMWRPW